MSNIVPYNGGSDIARRDVSRLSRDISKVQAGNQLRIARSFASEQLSMSRLDIMTAAAGSAAGHVARLGRLTQQLEMECPDAAEHLRAIKQAHVHFMVSELNMLERTMRYQ